MHHVRFAGLCSLQLNQARNPQESGPDIRGRCLQLGFHPFVAVPLT